MRPDPNRLHTKLIKAVNGPQKQFNTKDGPKEKYQVIFDDGYEAEYCPIVGKFDYAVSAGKTLCFRIAYRSNTHADEIEPSFIPSNSQQMQQQPGQSKILANMHSHPAVISLNAAMRYHSEIKKQQVELSDILADADVIRDWLDKEANIDSL